MVEAANFEIWTLTFLQGLPTKSQLTCSSTPPGSPTVQHHLQPQFGGSWEAIRTVLFLVMSGADFWNSGSNKVFLIWWRGSATSSTNFECHISTQTKLPNSRFNLKRFRLGPNTQFFFSKIHLCAGRLRELLENWPISIKTRDLNEKIELCHFLPI